MSFLSRRSSGDGSSMRRPSEVQMTDAAGEGAAREITPASLLAIGWRRKWTVIGCVVATTVAGVFYLRKATPLYTGKAQIYVKRDAPQIMNNNGTAAVLGTEDFYVYTQTTVLASTPVLEAALAKLPVDSMRTFPEGARPVEYLKNNLLIEVGKRDETITVSIDSPSREEAAQIVGNVIESYKEYTAARTETSALEILKLLQAEKEKRLAEQDAKHKELADFRKTHGTLFSITGQTGNIVYQRLGALQAQLTAAQVALLDARLAQAGHPNPMRARAAVDTAQKKVDELQVAFDQQKKIALDLNSDEAEFARLTSDITQLQTSIATIDMRIRDVDLNRDGGTAEIAVLEPAQASLNPTKPERAKTLALAMMLGLVAGGVLATMRELTDDRLRTTDDIVAALGMPVLGMIPHMTGRQSPAIRGRKVQREFMSEVAEAYRTLRTSIYFGTRNDPVKTLLITSPNQGDGKSTTASNLAIAIAQAGRRTLIIDTDFRRPQLHKIFELKDEVGLSSVLAGRETLDKAIHPTGVKGLEILPCGPIPSNPSEILNSEAFNKLLSTLGTRYDLVVLDSPPLSPITDARILGAICDATLLVLKAERSTRKGATLAADALHSVGARVLGVICNGLVKRSSSDHYTGYGYDVVARPNYRTAGRGDGRQLPAAQLSD